MKHSDTAVTRKLFAYLYIIIWLLYAWNIATPLWRIFVYVHVCIFCLYHICLNHNNATGTLNLLLIWISYFHSGACIWNIATPMPVLTQKLHGGLALLAPGHFETSVQTCRHRLSVNGTVAIWRSVINIWFCCFSDTLVADSLAPNISQGIRDGYKQCYIDRLLLVWLSWHCQTEKYHNVPIRNKTPPPGLAPSTMTHLNEHFTD